MDEEQIENFKQAIAQVESSGGKQLTNSSSSAAGRYQFLYRYIKNDPDLKGVSKREFNNSPKLQEKIMDKAISGKLDGFPGYRDHSRKIMTDSNTRLRQDEVMSLIHYLGPTGTRNYLNNPADFKVPGKTNIEVNQYLKKFNDAQGTRSTTDQINIEQSEILKQDRMPIVGPPMDEPSDSPSRRVDLINNEHANGGYSSGKQEHEELERFENGGTHEENPYGGIPMGMGDNGKMNTVEEGETRFSFDEGDYIFSNRLMCGGYSNKK